MTIVYVLLCAHFIADFVCQSDWMAANKSKQWNALLAHVVVYTVALMAVVAAVGSWGLGRGSDPAGPYLAFAAVNGVAHFVTDAITSRITSRLWFFQREAGIWQLAPYMVPRDDRQIINPWTPIEGKRHWFFVAIGADQLIHAVTLIATAEWLL